MNLDDIKLMFEYNTWADARILDAASPITAEQFDAPGAGISYTSLRGTFVHMLSAQHIWSLRLSGGFAEPMSREEYDAHVLKLADFPTLDSIRQHWPGEREKVLGFVNGLTDETLNGPIRYYGPDGKPVERVVWRCLYHLVNHGTQHRAEAAVLLTAYGCSPGDVDFNTVFLNQRP